MSTIHQRLRSTPMARATLMLLVVLQSRPSHPLSSDSIEGDGAFAARRRDAVGSVDSIGGDRDAGEEPGEVPVLGDERDRRERRDLRGHGDRCRGRAPAAGRGRR